MNYLLDSNAWVALLRNSSPDLAKRFQAQALLGTIRTCSIVIAELRHGALRSARPAVNRSKVEAILAPHPSLPFDDAAADHYARIRHDLETIGQIIGPLDMQIAAIAMLNSLTLVTHNVAEFRRVQGLLIEDWQVP